MKIKHFMDIEKSVELKSFNLRAATAPAGARSCAALSTFLENIQDNKRTQTHEL